MALLAAVAAQTPQGARADQPADVGAARAALSQDAHALADAGRQQRIPGFTEARIDDTSNAIDVYVTNDGASNVALIKSFAGNGEGVRVHAVPRDALALDAIMSKVVDDSPALEGEGVKVNTIRKDTERGVVVVGVDDPAAARPALTAKYGADVVVEQASGGTLASRIADSSPWYMGSFITDYSHDCTSGFAVHNSLSVKYIMTDAHCFGPNTTVRSGSWIIGQYAGAIGGVSSIASYSTNLDTELIRPASGAAGPNIYTGGGNDENTIYQYTYNYAPMVGDRICTDGAFEFQDCGMYIDKADFCATLYGVGTICHLSAATNTLGVQISGEGDSGGPVYVDPPSAQGARLLGSIEGFPGNGVTCSHYPGPNGSRHCSPTVWLQGIGRLLDHWGMNLNTSTY